MRFMDLFWRLLCELYKLHKEVTGSHDSCIPIWWNSHVNEKTAAELNFVNYYPCANSKILTDFTFAGIPSQAKSVNQTILTFPEQQLPYLAILNTTLALIKIKSDVEWFVLDTLHPENGLTSCGHPLINAPLALQRTYLPLYEPNTSDTIKLLSSQVASLEVLFDPESVVPAVNAPCKKSGKFTLSDVAFTVDPALHCLLDGEYGRAVLKFSTQVVHLGLEVPIDPNFISCELKVIPQQRSFKPRPHIVVLIWALWLILSALRYELD